jgi:hypothetical protein
MPSTLEQLDKFAQLPVAANWTSDQVESQLFVIDCQVIFFRVAMSQTGHSDT